MSDYWSGEPFKRGGRHGQAGVSTLTASGTTCYAETTTGVDCMSRTAIPSSFRSASLPTAVKVVRLFACPAMCQRTAARRLPTACLTPQKVPACAACLFVRRKSAFKRRVLRQTEKLYTIRLTYHNPFPVLLLLSVQRPSHFIRCCRVLSKQQTILLIRTPRRLKSLAVPSLENWPVVRRKD